MKTVIVASSITAVVAMSLVGIAARIIRYVALAIDYSSSYIVILHNRRT